MSRYVVRRLVIALVAVYAVVTLLFLFIHLIPGDPAELLLSGGGSAVPSPAAVAAMRHALHLDEPIGVQYATYLGGLIRLDLGHSFTSGRPVWADVTQRLPRTLELVVLATMLGVLVGVPLGTLAALRRGRGADVLASLVASSGIAIPIFVVGTVLSLVVGVDFGWLPASGYTAFSSAPLSNVQDVILPALSIAFGLIAVVARMTRSSVLEVLNQDWVRAARAKGLSRATVLARHVLRNAISPVMTVVGLQMGALLGGTVLVEYVFNWPGLSSLLVQAVQQRDYPEVQGIVLVIAVLFILLNLVVDVAYGFLDPRIQQR